MRSEKGILHNIGVLTLAQIVAQLLNVAALVYLARLVGSHWFGVLQIGVSISAYALIIAEGECGPSVSARWRDWKLPGSFVNMLAVTSACWPSWPARWWRWGCCCCLVFPPITRTPGS
ncbi:MAG: oligosaccharide flippase family protein [bacterium]